MLILSLTLTACGGGGGSAEYDDEGSYESNDFQGSGEGQDEDGNDGNGSNTGGTSGGVSAISGTHQVLAFNDLGMHCADLDYSTFVILPPFNVLHSQVIERGANPRLLNSTQAVDHDHQSKPARHYRQEQFLEYQSRHRQSLCL